MRPLSLCIVVNAIRILVAGLACSQMTKCQIFLQT